MQSRYRTSSDGYRPYRNPNPNPNPNRGRRPYQKPYHQPPAAAPAAPPRRGDVFMEAGRLAAEYFVSKGLLPPASLHRPAAQRREVAAAPEPRTSALARLGNPRGFDDEYTSQRGRKRNAPYARDYTNSEHDARRGQWRGYTDAIDEDDGGFAYQRRRFDEGGSSARTVVLDDRHSKSEATGESGTVVDEMIEDTTSSRNDRLTEGLADGSNVVGGAKVSSSEEVRSDVSGDSKKCNDGVMDGEPCVQGDESGAQPDSKSEVGNALGVILGAEIIEGEPIKESNDSNVKDQTGTMECQDSAISSGPPNDRREEGVESEHESEECPPGFEASKMPLDAIEEGDIAHDELEECPPGFEASKMPLDASEVGDMAQDELEECPPGFEASKMTLDESEEGDVAGNVDKMEGVKTQRECQEGEYSLQALEMKQSSPCVEGLSRDEMLERVDEKKPVGEEATLLPKFEPEIDVKMEEEKQLLASSFDLNLIGTPETTEIHEMNVIPEITEITEIPVDPVDHLQTSSPIAIPDDPVDHLQISSPIAIPDDPVDHLQTSSPIAILDDHIDHLETSSAIVIIDDHIDHLQTSSPISVADDRMGHLQTSCPSAEKGKGVAVNGDLSIGNNTDVTDDYAQLSVISKEIPVINLEVDSPIDDGGCDPSKLDNERMYSNMDNFPSETAQDLGIHDGYSLAFSDFLGTDMSGCSSVSGDLNNMQGGIGLHDAQGVTGDDDPIYVSLDEIPIGFMGLWDQPPSEYGKFY